MRAGSRSALTGFGMQAFLAGLFLAWILSSYGHDCNPRQLSAPLNPIFDTINFSFMEDLPSLLLRGDLLRQDPVPDNYFHEVIFVIRQKNIGFLIDILRDVSNPASREFGQHLSKLDVDQLTSNPASRDAVCSFLRSNGVTVVSQSKNGLYISAKARISLWERIFNTKFYNFRRTRRNGHVDNIVRAERYWIPRELKEHVESVFKTVEILDRLYSRESILDARIEDQAYDEVNPGKNSAVKDLLESHVGNISTKFLPDIERQKLCSLDLQNLRAFRDFSEESLVPCGDVGLYPSKSEDERNDDKGRSPFLQNMISISQESSLSSHQNTESIYTDWFLEVADMSSPPLVLSIGPWCDDSSLTRSVRVAFTTEAIKLGVMGVTILAFSEDTLKSSLLMENVSNDVATFPSSNQYVTSVRILSVRACSCSLQ